MIDTELLTLKRMLAKLENLHASFDYVKITLASSKRIKKWSERLLPNGEVIGEVLLPETLNFRTNIPEDYGLFCEKIFGPINDWTCQCKRYSGFAINKICEQCSVEITESRVRRYRMGHIDLMTPISHIWYLKGTPSYILLFLKDLEEKAMRIEKKIYRYKIKKENTRRAKLNKKHKQLIKDQPELRLTKLSIKFPYPLFTLKNLEEIIYFKQGEKWQLREHHFLNSFFDQDLNYDLRHFFEKTFSKKKKIESFLLQELKNGFQPFSNNNLTDKEFLTSVQADQKDLEYLKKKRRQIGIESKKSWLEYTSRFPLFKFENKFPYSEVKKKIIGGELIKTVLDSISLKEMIKEMREKLERRNVFSFPSGVKTDKSLLKRIRIYESFLASETHPSWMILTTIAVLPPNLRPLVELEGGLLVAADVNEIYRLIIIRNQRLFDFLYTFVAVELVIAQSKKLLQESVDSLIDNGRVAKDRRMTLNNKDLKGLTEILEGKEGRFRQSLLGKRVDYSGRSVIIVGPNLRLNQCGLPYKMGIELFEPFLLKQLFQTKFKSPNQNVRLANIIIRKNKPFVWELLVLLTKKYSILLNRAPTLHRFGVQAFDPILILGQAIHLHPLVCTGFNADFDGDQMAVHLPLYESTQLEAKTMMRPSYHVLSPSNGEVILKPTQDMVMGCYYLTLMISKEKPNLKKWFGNQQKAIDAFYQKKIDLHTPILVRYSHVFFELKLEMNKLSLHNVQNGLEFTDCEILIKKTYCLNSQLKTYAFITNIGIFLVYQNSFNSYQIQEFFLETSPGRLLFGLNFQKIIQK